MGHLAIDPNRRRMRLCFAGGIAGIAIWLATPEIKGSAVFYYLEAIRAAHDVDARYLLASAQHAGLPQHAAGGIPLPRLVQSRGSSVAHRLPEVQFLVARLVAIPCRPRAKVSGCTTFFLHFGTSALFSIVTVAFKCN